MTDEVSSEAVPFTTDAKLLLHSCCAPCSGSMIKVLVDLGIKVTILWYNPNIHPRSEYEIRKQENLKYAVSLGIPFVDLDYDTKEWFARAKGMELHPERGGRCTMCFDMRMERTALFAFENGFKWFTTTNATSRWKDVEQVNGSGRKTALKYDDVNFWEYNWQTDKLTRIKYEVSAENSFYKQEYCGCAYSLRDTNAYRKLNNQPAVTIGGGGVFSDPVLDSQEESQASVDAFFLTTNSVIQNMYEGRRKNNNARSNNTVMSLSESSDSGVNNSVNSGGIAGCGVTSDSSGGGKVSCEVANNW